MELWIRSQNKKKLYKCDEIDLEKEVFKDWCIETKIGNDYVVKDSWCIYINNKLFGRYFNEERALEVLDEIQNKIHQTYICEVDPIVSRDSREKLKLDMENKYPNNEFIIQPQLCELKPINSNVVIYEMPKE